MGRFGFCGPSYRSQSLNSDAQRCINLFTESDESGWGKTATSLYYTPGFRTFVSLGGRELSIRGLIAIDSAGSAAERVFAVAGPYFYEIFNSSTGGVPVLRSGAVSFTGTGLVSMAASPLQILIIDGGMAYCYNLATNTFQPLQTYTPGTGGLAAPFAVVSPGANYTIGDSVSPSAPGSGGQFTVTGILPPSGGGVFNAATTIAAPGSGFMVGDVVVPLGGGGTGAQLVVTSVSSGTPGTITGFGTPAINSPGSGYTVSDIVDPVGGGGTGGQIRITAVAPSSGGLVTSASVNISNPGFGYVVGDIVTTTLIPGTGAQFRVTAVSGGGVVSFVAVIAAGSGYHTTSNVVTAGGSGVGLNIDIVATPIAAGVPTAVSLVTGGTGYITTTGAATSGGTGTGLVLNITASPILTGAVTGIGVSVPGSGYVATANVPMSGGSGTGLNVNIAATPIVSGMVGSVVLTAPGTGYAPATNTGMTGGTGAGLQMSYATSNLIPGSGMISDPVLCAYIDGFFIVLQDESQVIQVSQPLDASAWDPTQFTQVSVFTDNVQSMVASYRQLWLQGSRQSQVYYNSGNVFPFDPVPGGFIEQGSGARFANAIVDNTMMWIGHDSRGSAMAWRANGYTPQRISTHAIEAEWQGYSRIDDAIGYSWQYLGHAFWRVYFPTAAKTWEYDAATNSWHEVESWNEITNSYGPHRSQCHVFAFGTHLVGDWLTGNIYKMDQAQLGENFNVIRRTRISPYVFREMEWIFHRRITIDVEVGLGPTPPLVDGNGNPRQPQLSLSWSDDQAKTFSNENILDCGFAGEFRKRVYLTQLGRSRGRVYRVIMSDPIPWRIADAYLDADPGFKPGERFSTSLGKAG